MEIAPALLEQWMRDYYFETEIDIGSSGVENFSLRELREILSISGDEMDQILFSDSRTLGGPALREAIANRWANGKTDLTMATQGSSEANYLIMNTLLKAGDEVVVLEPIYQQLRSLAESLGCTMKEWPLRPERGFAPDVEEGLKLIGPRTRMVVVNFPHNPTGVSITQREQEAIVEAAAGVGAWVVFDRAFAEITYDEPPLTEPTLTYDRAISMGTLSKAYGLPGLRVGWLLASPDVLERCIRLRDYTTLHLSPMVEFIAQKVIENGDTLVARRIRQARVNRDIVCAWMEEHEDYVSISRPQGGVTAFVCLHRVGDVDGFCRRLAVDDKVLLVPGSCFNHPRYVRLGFGGPTGELKTGLGRLSQRLRMKSNTSSKTRSLVSVEHA